MIVDEPHECTQKLGCDRYYLMAHSLSGLYSLYWANTYPQEVAGFIGIDPSVPKQSDEEPLPISMVTLNRLFRRISRRQQTYSGLPGYVR